MYYPNLKKDKNYLKEQFEQNEKNLKKIQDMCTMQENEKLKINCDKLFKSTAPISSIEIGDIDFNSVPDDKKNFFGSWVKSTLESNILKIRTFIIKNLNDNIDKSKYEIIIKLFCLLDQKIIKHKNLNNFYFNFEIFDKKKLKDFYYDTHILMKNLNSGITTINDEWNNWGRGNAEIQKCIFLNVESFLLNIHFFSKKTLKIFDNILNNNQNKKLKELTENLLLMEAYHKYFFESEITAFIKIKNYFLAQEKIITVLQSKILNNFNDFIDIENNIVKDIKFFSSIKNTKDKFKELNNKCSCISCKAIEHLFNTKINIKRNFYAHNSYIDIIDEDFDILNDESQNIKSVFYIIPFNLILTLIEKSYWWLAFFITTLDHDKFYEKLNKKAQKLF